MGDPQIAVRHRQLQGFFLIQLRGDVTIQPPEQGFFRLQKSLMIADSGEAAGSDHLGLKPVGQNVQHIVAQHILRFFGDQPLRFQHVSLGGVLFLQDLQFLRRPFPEQVLKQLIHVPPILHFPGGGPSLVQDFDRGPIGFRLLDGVAVDIVTEDVMGFLPLPDDDRCSGKPDLGAVR